MSIALPPLFDITNFIFSEDTIATSVIVVRRKCCRARISSHHSWETHGSAHAVCLSITCPCKLATISFAMAFQRSASTFCTDVKMFSLSAHRQFGVPSLHVVRKVGEGILVPSLFIKYLAYGVAVSFPITSTFSIMPSLVR